MFAFCNALLSLSNRGTQRLMARSADILTYIGNSTSNRAVSLGLPLLGGVTLAGGGYSHAIVRVKDGRVAEVRYSG
jgi:hypothetical protein